MPLGTVLDLLEHVFNLMELPFFLPLPLPIKQGPSLGLLSGQRRSVRMASTSVRTTQSGPLPGFSDLVSEDVAAPSETPLAVDVDVFEKLLQEIGRLGFGGVVVKGAMRASTTSWS